MIKWILARFLTAYKLMIFNIWPYCAKAPFLKCRLHIKATTSVFPLALFYRRMLEGNEA